MEGPVRTWHWERIPALDKTDCHEETEEHHDVMIRKLTDRYKDVLLYF
jgi:hypothetical protein